MTDSIQLDLAINRGAAAVLEQPQLIFLLANITPRQDGKLQRLPLNFILLLDQSGSMAGEKLRTLKAAVNHLIDRLDEQDVLSVVTFESRAQVLYPAQPVKNKAELKQRVDEMREGGGTNLSRGLQAALEQAAGYQQEGRITRLVLLTDGEATDREQDSANLADEAGRRGIPIISLGFGQDWNENFLFDLADRSILAAPGSRMGAAEYIPAPQDALRIFEDVYRSMEVVGQDALLTLRLVQGVEARRIWQAAPMIRDLGRGVLQGRSVQVEVGQLEQGGLAYLVELMLPPRPAGLVRVAQADVTYRDIDGQAQRCSADLVVPFTTDPEALKQLNGQVMNVVEKVQAFRLQTQALEDAQAGSVEHATRKLRQAVTILLNQGETDLAGQMEKEAEQLEQSGQISNEGKKTILLTSRKTVRLSDD
jgi:Ca-activated chloride channel family protein